LNRLGDGSIAFIRAKSQVYTDKS
jgi:hypothetical protein